MTEIKVNPGRTITEGNNPWIDAVTYNAQWQQGNWSKPVRLSINFIQPDQFNSIDNLSTVKKKISNPTYIGWDPKNPISEFPKSVRETYLKAYQAWSEVALIEATPVEQARKADVVFTLANYNYNGFVSGDSGPQLEGSHEGLLGVGSDGLPKAKPAITPLISDANAWEVQKKLQPGGSGVEPGSSFFGTAIHEIGHGIGLSHPHDIGLGSVPSGVFPGLTPNDSFGNYGTGLYALNQKPFTIMGYVKGYQNGSPFTSSSAGITPMALDVMAAQLKYGVNQNTRSGDDIYNLDDIIKLNAWQCIWDTGGLDTITGENFTVPLVINLRPAEMNGVRPETGSPSERYDWGFANEWGEVLDTFLSLTSSRMGYMLGSGVVEAYSLGWYLDQIHSRDQQSWIDIQQQVLDPLSDKLSKLSNLSFDYSDWSRAISTLAGGDLSSLAPKLLEQAGAATSREESRTLKIAAKAAGLFNNLNIQFGALYEYAAGLQAHERLVYLEGLSEARANQNVIMSRSAPGVAGYTSTYRSELYRSYGNEGGFTIAAGVTIETAKGGHSDDEIIGNAADNRLFGNGGNDLIEGYIGNNLIDGGAGTDTAILISNLSDYTFSGNESNLIATNMTRGYENTLISIEAVRIGDFTYSPTDLLLPIS